MNSPSNSAHSQRPQQQTSRLSYLWLCRTQTAYELLRQKNGAFRLLALIGMRARYSGSDDLNMHGLEVGEAFVGRGDHRECGISEKEYRTALRLLADWSVVSKRTIKGRGTVVKILNRAIFDPLTGYELGQLRGQPFFEEEESPKGQLRGHIKGQQRAKPGATKGPLTNKEYKAKKNNDLSIWEAGMRIKAIDREIGKIKSADSNFVYENGQKRLKDEPREKVRLLRADKDRAEKIEAGLSV